MKQVFLWFVFVREARGESSREGVEFMCRWGGGGGHVCKGRLTLNCLHYH